MKQLLHANSFLVQFRAAGVGAVQLPGRVEHVSSGLTATFDSIDDLPQLLFVMLRATDSQPRGLEQ
jgi:hypothetical protein